VLASLYPWRKLHELTIRPIKIAYATGLLVARRALTKLGLADKYAGVEEPDGTLTMTEALDDEDAPRPFKCFLDAGLKRTSTGSRVFGALKGASDGGIFIPHNDKRMPGYDPEAKELDAEVLKKYIFGGHVAEYMESLEEEDDERYVSYLHDGHNFVARILIAVTQLQKTILDVPC
jgi:large subunit ribosomal protein L5e